jgi:hypothetical protein
VSVLVGHADAEKSAKLQHRLQGLFRSIEAPIRRYLSRARDDAVVRPGHMKAPETPKEEQVSGFQHFLFLFLCFSSSKCFRAYELAIPKHHQAFIVSEFFSQVFVVHFEKFSFKKNVQIYD